MFTINSRRASLFATALILGLAAVPASAADEDVVARVGAAEITEGDIALAEEGFGTELANLPAAQRRSVLIDIMVDMQILSQAALASGLDKTEEFSTQMAFLRTRALRNAYVKQEVVDRLTDDEVAARYEERIAEFEPQEEVRARHILVETEDEAKAIIAELDGGADFAELARDKSTGPTGPNGGDLGYFQRGQMVPEFENAAFSLEKGGHTAEPVQTQFGWHVIKAEDLRKSAPPSLESLAEQIRAEMLRERFDAVMTNLREVYPVEIVAGEATAQ